MTEQATGACVTDVPARTLAQWIESGDTVIIDVREDFEHASERIEGAHHHGLSDLDCDEIRGLYPSQRVVFQCRTGKRSTEAARRYATDGDEEAFHLAGGIEAWRSAGLGTERTAAAPKIDVMRQVQMTAGSLVLIGVLLGAFVNPLFLILSGFVGAGLFFAGASGWCGMAKLLAKMPWNR